MLAIREGRPALGPSDSSRGASSTRLVPLLDRLDALVRAASHCARFRFRGERGRRGGLLPKRGGPFNPKRVLADRRPGVEFALDRPRAPRSFCQNLLARRGKMGGKSPIGGSGLSGGIPRLFCVIAAAKSGYSFGLESRLSGMGGNQARLRFFLPRKGPPGMGREKRGTSAAPACIRGAGKSNRPRLCLARERPSTHQKKKKPPRAGAGGGLFV